MLYKRMGQHLELCVLKVNANVLELPRVVITDANASSDYVRFAAAPEGLEIVDRDLTFADYWTDSDPIQYFRKKSAKCAEVLVPERINPQSIMGVYVSCREAKEIFYGLGTGIDVTINSHMFFR